MIKFTSIFILAILSLNSFSQKIFDKKTLDNFLNNNNDSIFISNHSDASFHSEEYTFGYSTDSSSNPIMSALLNGKAGNIYGPFTTDTSIYYIKISSADSAFKTNVGNIWINIKKGREVALETANHILSEVKSGKDFNLYCKMYSDDKNNKKDCDLGWVFNTNFVEPFAGEIIKHKRDDVYLIETSYGFHIVKTLSNPYKARHKTTYIMLTKRK